MRISKEQRELRGKIFAQKLEESRRIEIENTPAYKQAHYDGACWMLDSIRASLRGYPDNGGDKEVMKEVERIVKEAIDKLN